MADYDTTVGIQLTDDFEQTTINIKKMINAFDSLEKSLKNVSSQIGTINNVTSALDNLSKVNFNNVDKSIDKVAKSVSSLESKLSKLNISSLTGVVDALRGVMNSSNMFNLSGIEKITKIPKIMDSIKSIDSKNLGKVFSTLATQIQPFIAKLKEAHAEINNLGSVIKAIDKFDKKFGNMTSSANKFKESIEKSKAKINELGNESNKSQKKINSMFKTGNMIYFFNMSKRLFTGFGNMLKKSIDFAETENLFSVAMRNMRGEAMKFQNTMSEAFGLATPDMMKAQAMFKNMLSSLEGLNQNTSTGLSEVMTKMSVDFASLFNTSIESALTKMQAALSRQVRPIRSVSGYDITQNVLGESLKQMGIYDRAVSKLSEMEKRLVIIYTLQQQMARSGAMGDFARTIENQSQQLKILQQQLSETGRWIGAVFMGTIGKVLPYINAFVMVIKELIKSFAMLVGYKIPDSTGIENVLDQMDTGAVDFGDALGEGVDNANEGLDKAKKTVDSLLAPFDKLNIIQKPKEDTPTGGTGGSGGGIADGIGGIDDRILASLGEYNNLMDSVKMKATSIRDRIMDWLGFTKTVNELTGETVWKMKDGYTNIEKIRDVISAIGISMLSWKIAKSVMNFIEAFNSGKIVGTCGALGNIWKAFNSPSGETVKLMSMFGNKTAFVGTAGVMVGIATTIAVIALRFYDLYTNSEDFRRGLSVAWEMLKGISSMCFNMFKDVYDSIAKVTKSLGLSEEATRGWLLRLGAVALLFTPAAPFAVAYLIFDGIASSIKALGYAFSPCIKQMDNLGGASAQTKTNLEPMLDTMDDMEKNLKQMDWSNIAPSPEAVKKANDSVNKFSNDLIKHLEVSKKKAIDTMSELFKQSSFSQDEQNKMITGVNKTYDGIATKIKKAQETITGIYNKATAENRELSKDEVKAIADNQEWLKAQSVQVLSASAEEQNKIMDNMKANANALSVEQASEIIKNSVETRNKTKAEAEGRYNEQIAIANKLKLDGGAENTALADKIISEAERQKNVATTKAEEMHNNIVGEFRDQNPKIAQYMDENTGNIKTRLNVWLESFNSWCSDCGNTMGNWWNNNIAPWFSWSRWRQLGTDCIEGVKSGINGMLQWFNPVYSWFNDNIAPWFSWSKWYNLGMGAVDSVISAFSNFEFPSFKLPHIRWVADGFSASGWIKDILEALSLPTSIPSLSVEWYRKGGFVGEGAGQLFAANEPGNPELVGNIGGRTAVVNNNMIIESIEGAMERAIIKGMMTTKKTNKSDGTTVIEVYLGNELIETQIVKANDKHIRKTGKPVFSR